MQEPYSYLCGMRCVSGTMRCPSFDTCGVNKNLIKGIFMRYINCCRREMKYENKISLGYQELEQLVRRAIAAGFRCPTCGKPMTINNGQTADTTIYSIEHVVPMAKGGKNTVGNIIVCCRKCNYENNEAGRDL